jgi:two-component system, NtrC family, nitrogen regulation sensor histidine kinase NtrY
VSFRARLFLALVLAALLPLSALAFGVRREMTRRLTAENTRRGDAAVAALRDDLARESATVAARLATLTAELGRDNGLRLALVQGDAGARRGLLDLAGSSMRSSGLTVLQLQDSAGRILSSGHFRNAYDRVEPALPRALVAAGTGPVLVRARTADTTLLVLGRLDSLRVAGARYTVIGGTAIEPRLRGSLARDPDLSLRLAEPGTAAPGAGATTQTEAGASPVATLSLPFIDERAAAETSNAADTSTRADTARLVVTRSPGTLAALRRSIDRWFLAALAATVGLAILGAWWLSTRVSRPLTELAARTAAIDFDRLDQSFPSDRADEIGALATTLGAMTERLRLGAARLREAERRLATGDLARQVNHDIKNGLVPIRNVLRHLSEVARDDPAALPRIFEERRGTLESSLAYLDTLARNYARLSPAAQPTACDVNAMVAEIVRATGSAHATLRAAPDPALPVVSADPLVLRRILENLVGNAVDSVAGQSDGVVTVGTEAIGGAESAQVRVTVTDTGPGMSRAELDRAFDDFHTTKAGGTGLGLSIVRRLVLDLGGALRIETAPGAGTRAIVELPVRAAAAVAPTADGRNG